jgi:hypothetical protein
LEFYLWSFIQSTCFALRAKLIAAVIHAPTPPQLPPFCSDCATKTEPAGGGALSQSASRVWRSSDGKYRLDTPKTSVISDPAAQQTILLDHVKKEAMIIPTPPAEQGSAVPGLPHAPAAQGQAQLVKVEDLGKSMIEGHEVDGKRFTLPPFTPPAKPEMPKDKMPGGPQLSMPGVPKPPAAPSAPATPQPPKLPPVPSVTEVWTSTKLNTPVLTKVTTSAGEQTTYCKPASMDEPHPSVFQIPQGYKIKPPKL